MSRYFAILLNNHRLLVADGIFHQGLRFSPNMDPEIRYMWVVEGYMPVFTNSHKDNVGRII
jgi:hypothetical protein